MEVIKAQELSKVYQYYKKQKGIRGSVKNLFRREMLFKEAVKDFNVSIEKGSIVGFVGLNGAGKTTTLKMLSGILRPSSGNVEVCGYNPFDKKPDFLKKISMVMGNKGQLWWDIPAIESIELNKHIFEVEEKNYKRILDELVESLDVKHLLNVQVRRLSLGERMKMELISALIHSPTVMFLDEPTIGLDMISQHSIRRFLKSYNERYKSTIILTSHNINDIVHLCNRLILINNGSIIHDSSFDSFVKQYCNKKVVTMKFSEISSDVCDTLDKFDLKIIEKKTDQIMFSIMEDHILKFTHELTSRHLNTLKDISIENTDIEEIIKNIYSSK